MNEFRQQVNAQADLRDYLVTYIDTLPITDANSLLLQATFLAEFTKAINQLTRAVLV
jgi:hypothetical protein